MILVINSGSSSVKIKLFTDDLKVVAQALGERLNTPKSKIMINNQEFKEENLNHQNVIQNFLNYVREKKIVTDLEEITKVGHRVVHGGEYFKKPTVVDADVLEKITQLSDLSPLHNPANAMGIRICEQLLPQAVNIAVFDTAFHQTMPEIEYIYPVPYEWYEKYGVRRYGAHGTSHQYCYEQAKKQLGKAKIKQINCHLGNGSSICAIKDGESIATSMGLTPLGGIAMGTRSGDLDPSIISHIAQQTNQSSQEIINILNNESGLKGLSKMTNDMRDLEACREENKLAELAINIYINRIVEVIASYFVKLQGIDVLSFTGGIGENSDYVREAILEKVKVLGINESTVNILVIPADEELAIANFVSVCENCQIK